MASHTGSLIAMSPRRALVETRSATMVAMRWEDDEPSHSSTTLGRPASQIIPARSAS